jgi:uncharacterized protein YndB with AHSA1/START domain
MTTKSSLDLVITRRIQATPERVFDAWIAPETALKWLSGGVAAQPPSHQRQPGL